MRAGPRSVRSSSGARRARGRCVPSRAAPHDGSAEDRCFLRAALVPTRAAAAAGRNFGTTRRGRSFVPRTPGAWGPLLPEAIVRGLPAAAQSGPPTVHGGARGSARNRDGRARQLGAGWRDCRLGCAHRNLSTTSVLLEMSK